MISTSYRLHKEYGRREQQIANSAQEENALVDLKTLRGKVKDNAEEDYVDNNGHDACHCFQGVMQKREHPKVGQPRAKYTSAAEQAAKRYNRRRSECTACAGMYPGKICSKSPNFRLWDATHCKRLHEDV